MKIAGFVVLIGFAIVGAMAAGMFVLVRFERPVSHFRTYAELRASGLIERGWVSEYLPRSATDIEEMHDLDTNESWASFKYRAGDTTVADGSCKLLQQTNAGRKYLCPPFEDGTAILVLRADGSGTLTVFADGVL